MEETFLSQQVGRGYIGLWFSAEFEWHVFFGEYHINHNFKSIPSWAMSFLYCNHRVGSRPLESLPIAEETPVIIVGHLAIIYGAPTVCLTLV